MRENSFCFGIMAGQVLTIIREQCPVLLAYWRLLLFVSVRRRALWKLITYFMRAAPLVGATLARPALTVPLAVFGRDPSVLGLHFCAFHRTYGGVQGHCISGSILLLITTRPSRLQLVEPERPHVDLDAAGLVAAPHIHHVGTPAVGHGLDQAEQLCQLILATE